MSYTSYAEPITPSLEWRLPRLACLAGQGALWLAAALGFAATLYLLVAWPGLVD